MFSCSDVRFCICGVLCSVDNQKPVMFRFSWSGFKISFFCIVIQYLSCCFCDSKRSNGDVLFCIGDFSFPSLYSQMLHAKTAVHVSLLKKSQKHRIFFSSRCNNFSYAIDLFNDSVWFIQSNVQF